MDRRKKKQLIDSLVALHLSAYDPDNNPWDPPLRNYNFPDVTARQRRRQRRRAADDARGAFMGHPISRF